MGNLAYRLSSKFILSAFGLFLIGSLPALFRGISVDFVSYFNSLGEVLNKFLHPSSLVYLNDGVPWPLFPQILGPWLDSMRTFFLPFFCAFIIALAAAYVTLLLPPRFSKVIRFISFILESLPDILIIALLQLGVIWFYQKTGALVFNIAAYGEASEPVVLPIIVMTVLPTIMLYRLMLLDFRNEEEKPYVELAKSLGLKRQTILLVHIFRNAVIHIFIDSKFILWMMLSNLLIVEYLFNLQGVIHFMLGDPSPLIFTVGLFLLFVPIFVFMAIGQSVIEKLTARKVEM
ncbi:MAG TPA: ABC transporter permease subunit [Bacillales bacterium]|nr:ABC transporter permease subunit [Bacillales bacterium]